MIRVYYAIASDNVDPALLTKLSKLIERYIAIFDYDNIFTEWLQRPTETEPTVITGPKQKAAVIQLAVDILPRDQFINIFRHEVAMDRLSKVARKIVSSTPVRLLIRLLAKMGVKDLSTNLILGKIAFVIANAEDFKEAGITSPKDFVQLAKLGWNNFAIIDEDRGIVTICSKLSPKCFVIPLKSLDIIAKNYVHTSLDIFKKFKSVPFSVAIGKLISQ